MVARVDILSGILVESGIPVTVIPVVDCTVTCYLLGRELGTNSSPANMPATKWKHRAPKIMHFHSQQKEKRTKIPMLKWRLLSKASVSKVEFITWTSGGKKDC